MRTLIVGTVVALILLVSCAPTFGQQSSNGPNEKPFSNKSNFMSQTGHLRWVRADLAPTGRLRVALQFLNPALGTKNAATGEISGITVDLGRALAAHLGVPFVPVEYPSPAAILDGLKTRAWDVTFLAIDPSRAALMDFSPPYMNWDNTLVVRSASTIRSVADANRSGITIAAPGGTAIEQIAARTLPQARIVRVANAAAGLDAVRLSQADAYAGSRPAILITLERFPDLRVLPDSLAVEQNAIGLPKGHAAGRTYVTDFVEWAKASGLVRQAIEHAGVRGAQVAPPAAEK